jgi:hypothetical protein
MKKTLATFAMLALAQTASAQVVGDAGAGKAHWDRGAPRATVGGGHRFWILGGHIPDALARPAVRMMSR